MTLSRAFPKERIDTGPHDVAPSATTLTALSGSPR